ncbi:MAG: hypothetical protein ACHQUC_10335 [Chlamydiales bacterium]
MTKKSTVDDLATLTISPGIGQLQSANIEEHSEIASAIPSSRSSIPATFRSVTSSDEIMKIADDLSDLVTLNPYAEQLKTQLTEIKQAINAIVGLSTSRGLK